MPNDFFQSTGEGELGKILSEFGGDKSKDATSTTSSGNYTTEVDICMCSALLYDTLSSTGDDLLSLMDAL